MDAEAGSSVTPDVDIHASTSRQQAFGHQPVTLLNRYLNAYKVETTDGITITKGWRTGRINRT